MIAVICVDDQGGTLFHHRRQSQDRLLRQNLLEEAAGRAVWMNAYSRGQFAPLPENIRTAEDFYRRAGAGEFCFFEDVDPMPWLGRAEKVILYHWNRKYPADQRVPLPLAGWETAEMSDFAGSSHTRISKEVLTPCST